MSQTFTAACIQMRAGTSLSGNGEAVRGWVREAAKAGAHYVQTPEMTNILQPKRDLFFETIKPEAEEPVLALLREEARTLGLWLHIGSLAVLVGERKAANRGFMIAPTGEIVARYDKIHMFDVDLPDGTRYRESAAYEPGGEAVLVDLPWARWGMSICYDMRFPGLYRALAEEGAAVLTAPSSFTVPTGKAHWHVLLRSRAIENGAFMIAAAQGGTHESGRETFGHSLIIDPWGRVIAEADHDAPGIVMAEIDLARVAEARGNIPSLKNGRSFSLRGGGISA